MASLYTQQGRNIRKTWFLMTGFLVGVIALGWLLGTIYESYFIIYLAVGIALAMNFTAYWWSDTLALRSTGARIADETQYRELHRILENLAITAGLPKPRLYIIDDPAPNAYATGRNAKNAAVAVTTGLLAQLDRSELEGVIAHELAHIGNRDILVMTVAVVLAGTVAILADIFLRMSIFGGGGNRDNKSPLLFIFAVVAIILAPLAAQLIKMAVSRRREFLADATGALITRYPEGLASALQKISGYRAPMQRASHATAHMFISNPFGAVGARTFMEKLFSTHPPMEQRIASLNGMKV